jgi:hypothetical protein
MSRTQGLATLSAALAPIPLGAVFQPQHSWASPFKALLLSCGRLALSSLPLRPCALLHNLSAMNRRSSVSCHQKKPSPSLCLPHGLNEGRVYALLGFPTSQVFSSVALADQSLSDPLPLSLLCPRTLTSPLPPSLRVFPSTQAASPLTGTYLSGFLHRLS